MSLLTGYDVDVLTPESAGLAAANQVTPFGEYFGAKFTGGVADSFIGQLYQSYQTPSLVGREFDPSTGQELPPDPAKLAAAGAMTEDQFKADPLSEGIPFQPGMSRPRLEALAQQRAARNYRESLIARSDPGALGMAAGLVGSIAGSAVDPVNYIPIVGPAGRAAAVARLGTIAGHAAVGAFEATVGTALAEPFIASSLNARGAEMGVQDVIADLALSAAAGALFGGGLATVGSFAERRARIREAARVLKVDGALAQVQQLEAGHAQLVADEPIDLAPYAQAQEFRRRQLQGAAAIRPADLTPEIRGLPERVPLPDFPEVSVREGADGPEVDVHGPQMQDRAFTAAGRPIDVRYEVVDARALITSHNDELQVNDAFPAELQPRDRTRAASSAQVAQIAGALNPELLGRSATAADGAPIVGPDDIVESGNARALAVRRAYAQQLEGGARYRAWLEQQGYDLAGIEQPVLIRRRTTELDRKGRRDFTREANTATVATMGTAERAVADAAGLRTDLLELLESADLTAVGNRQFVRGFIGGLPESERAGLLTATGELSKGGAERIRNALLAKAYGDADLVARLAEEPESGLGTLGRALADVAPNWSRLAAEIETGAVAPEGDATPALLEAVNAIVDARDKGNPLHFALGQADLFTQGNTTNLTADGRAFLVSMLTFDKRGNSRLVGAQRITEILQGYVHAARQQAPGVDMFGTEPSRPAELMVALEHVRPELGAPLRQADYGAVSVALALDQAKRAQPFEDVAGLFRRAEEHQGRLAAVAADVEKATGAKFKNPGVKERATTEEKLVRKNYRDARQLTDVIRGGFIVKSAEQADQVIAELGRVLRVLDEGWNVTPAGYFDRKALVIFDDGTIGEIQLLEPNLLEAKKEGHKLYDQERVLPKGDPRKAELVEQQKAIYAKALDVADPSVRGIVSNPPAPRRAARKAESSSARDRTLPDSATSEELTSSQPPPGDSTAQARDPLMTAGRPSQSTNTADIASSPSADVVTPEPERNEAPGLFDVTGAAEAPPNTALAASIAPQGTPLHQLTLEDADRIIAENRDFERVLGERIFGSPERYREFDRLYKRSHSSNPATADAASERLAAEFPERDDFDDAVQAGPPITEDDARTVKAALEDVEDAKTQGVDYGARVVWLGIRSASRREVVEAVLAGTDLSAEHAAATIRIRDGLTAMRGQGLDRQAINEAILKQGMLSSKGSLEDVLELASAFITLEVREAPPRYEPGGPERLAGPPRRLLSGPPEITAQERAALRSFKDLGYLNQRLLAAGELDAKAAAKARDQAGLIDSALAKHRLEEPARVYRGIAAQKIAQPGSLVGRHLPATSFLPTSTDREIGLRYAGAEADGGVLLELDVPAGARALQLDQFQRPGRPAEEEVLLPRDGSFLVRETRQEGNVTVLAGTWSDRPAPSPFDDEAALAREIAYRRAAVDSLTTARPLPRHPSVAAAAGRVGSGDELKTFAQDAGLDQPDLADLEDVEVLRAEGLVTAEDEADLRQAEQLQGTAGEWADAYRTLASCVLRFAT